MNDDRTNKWPTNLQRAASAPGRYLVFLSDGTQLFISHAEPADKFGAWIRLYFRSKYPPSVTPYVGVRRNGESIRLRTKYTEIRVASIREVRETQDAPKYDAAEIPGVKSRSNPRGAR